MFCPTCRDEFRAGFTRCARCEVDLVSELPPEREADPPPQVPARLADYCGFLVLDDAREARDRLREQQIMSEIVIREAPGTDPDGPFSEEFWLRVDAGRYGEVHAVLGDVAQADGVEDED